MVSKYRINKPLAVDIQRKLILSQKESATLERRDLNCPYCGFLLDRIFSDATGHRESKCQKCKREIIINMAYFRKVKRRVPGNCR